MKPKKKLKGHKNVVQTVAWSLNGEVLASGDSFSALILWNKEGKDIKKLEVPEYTISDLAWTEGMLASAGQNMIRLWDMEGNQIKEIDGKTNDITRVSWAPDGKKLAANSIEFKINIWDIDGNLIKTLEKHTTYVNAFGWCPDANASLFVTAGQEAKIYFWDPNSWTEIKELSEHYESPTDLAWAPNGQNFAVGTYLAKLIRIYDREGKSIQELKGHKDKITAIDWSSDGQMIISGSADKTVKIWKPDGTVIETLNIKKVVTDVNLSPDNQSLAVSMGDKTILIYDLSELEKK